MPTYRATCPDCGATMPLNVPGDLYAGCPECAFYGWVPTLTAAIGPTPRLPLSPAAPSPAPTPTTPPESFFVMGDVMGDYAPDAEAVGAAIVAVTVAQLVALLAVGRLCSGDSDGGAE